MLITNDDCDPEIYIQSCPQFRSLSIEECKDFRLAAQENYESHTPIDMLWHPVYRDECKKINESEKTVFRSGSASS